MITTATFNAAQHSITAATTTSCSKCVNDPCGAPKDAVAPGLRQEECWGEDLKLTYLACRHRQRLARPAPGKNRRTNVKRSNAQVTLYPFVLAG